MNKIIAAAIAVSATALAVSSANAAEGCGRGYHRGPHGHCRVNYSRAVVAVPIRPAIGIYYRGHGYWDGRRYWQHRYRHQGHWRYR